MMTRASTGRGARLALVLALAWMGKVPASSANPDAPNSASPIFEREVRPILKAHCFHCHGEGDALKGGVDLRLKRFMESTVTESGRVITPGSPDKSLMIQLIRSGDMPKGEQALSDREISVIEAWVAGGAPTARAEPESLSNGFVITEEEKAFWSFQPSAAPPRRSNLASEFGHRLTRSSWPGSRNTDCHWLPTRVDAHSSNGFTSICWACLQARRRSRRLCTIRSKAPMKECSTGR